MKLCYVRVMWAAAAICFGLGGYGLFLQRGFAEWSWPPFACGTVLVALPAARRVRITRGGLEIETTLAIIRQERAQAEQARNQAELAARIAWVVSSTQAVMYENHRGRLEDIRAVRELLVDAANRGRAITVDDTAELWEYKEDARKILIEDLDHRHEQM